MVEAVLVEALWWRPCGWWACGLSSGCGLTVDVACRCAFSALSVSIARCLHLRLLLRVCDCAHFDRGGCLTG